MKLSLLLERLSPLSYIVGALTGNPSIRLFDGPTAFGEHKIVSSCKVLHNRGIAPIPLASKEHLGILNGTAFSSSVAALALNDAIHLMLLYQVCTKALAGTRASFNSFINAVARPHPRKIETAKYIWDLLEGSNSAVTYEEEFTIEGDEGTLRQDRYPLRRPSPSNVTQQPTILWWTVNSPRWQLPSDVHHQCYGKDSTQPSPSWQDLFGQCAELIDPAMNRGLPPSLAATDPPLSRLPRQRH